MSDTWGVGVDVGDGTGFVHPPRLPPIILLLLLLRSSGSGIEATQPPPHLLLLLQLESGVPHHRLAQTRHITDLPEPIIFYSCSWPKNSAKIILCKFFFLVQIFVLCARIIFLCTNNFCARIIFLCKKYFFVQKLFLCAKIIFLWKNYFFVKKLFCCEKIIFLCKNYFFTGGRGLAFTHLLQSQPVDVRRLEDGRRGSSDGGGGDGGGAVRRLMRHEARVRDRVLRQVDAAARDHHHEADHAEPYHRDAHHHLEDHVAPQPQRRQRHRRRPPISVKVRRFRSPYADFGRCTPISVAVRRFRSRCATGFGLALAISVAAHRIAHRARRFQFRSIDLHLRSADFGLGLAIFSLAILVSLDFGPAAAPSAAAHRCTPRIWQRVLRGRMDARRLRDKPVADERLWMLRRDASMTQVCCTPAAATHAAMLTRLVRDECPLSRTHQLKLKTNKI